MEPDFFIGPAPDLCFDIVASHSCTDVNSIRLMRRRKVFGIGSIEYKHG